MTADFSPGFRLPIVPTCSNDTYYQARPALKIPSEAKKNDGNGISVGVFRLRRTADGIFYL